MKKIIIFTMLLASICSTALAQTADDYDSETIKHAYNAPRSAFINKWLDVNNPNASWTFKSDGTVIYSQRGFNETLQIHWTLQTSGKWTWTPSQRRLTITINHSNDTMKVDQKEFAKQLEGVKVMVKEWMAYAKKNILPELQSHGTVVERYEVCRIDDDYLMWDDMNNIFVGDATPDVYISESTYKAMRY